jgi:hypothetical protein
VNEFAVIRLTLSVLLERSSSRSHRSLIAQHLVAFENEDKSALLYREVECVCIVEWTHIIIFNNEREGAKQCSEEKVYNLVVREEERDTRRVH